MNRAPMTLILFLLILTSTALAGDHPHDRKGLVLGFNAGGANGVLDYDRLGSSIEREIEGGFGGSGRIGYAVSNSVVLSLDVRVFHKKDGPVDVSSGLGLVTVTWHPGGGGFFLRAGAGSGQADVKLPFPDNALWVEREGDAGLIGLGYEWRLGRQFALGVALDAYGMEYEDLPGFQDTALGFGSASLQLQWYL